MKITEKKFLITELYIEGDTIRDVKGVADEYEAKGWRIGALYKGREDKGFIIEIYKREEIK